jgi:hypothetical protein
MSRNRPIGQQWINPFSGRVYLWDGKQWVWTGEEVPVPQIGESS